MSKFPETSVTMIERMRNGEFSDLEAWSRSIQRYYAPAERYVCWSLGLKSPDGHPECHDIVQDAFAKMWGKIQKDGFDRLRTGSFRKYFETCIQNAKNDYFRAAKRIKEDLIIDKSVEDSDGHLMSVQKALDPDQDPNKVVEIILDPDPKDQEEDSNKEVKSFEEKRQKLIECFLNASMNRVMSKSHLSDENRQIVKLINDGEEISEVAERCKTTADNVRHVKSRYLQAVRQELEKLAAEDFLLKPEDLKYLEQAELLKSLCS